MGIQLLAIAGNTLTESIRQPIFTVMVLVGAMGLALNPSLAAYSLEHGGDIQMLITMGLSMVAVITLMLAAFTAAGVLSEEIESRTVLTVVSKPVPRFLFVTGKFLGIAGAVGLAFYALGLILLLSVRHGVLETVRDQFDQPVITFGVLAGLGAVLIAAGGNYFYRRVFTSNFIVLLCVFLSIAMLLVLVIDSQWQLQSPLMQLQNNDWQLAHVMVGLLIIFQAMVIVTGVALVCSTRLGRMPTLLICVGITLLGLVSNSINAEVDRRLSIPPTLGFFDSIHAVLGSDAAFHVKLASLAGKMMYMIMPNFQFLWPADAIAEGTAFTVSHIMLLMLYAGTYTLGLICLGIILFQEREVG